MKLQSLNLDKHTMLDILDTVLEVMTHQASRDILERELGMDLGNLYDRSYEARKLLIKSLFSKATT